MRFFKNNFSDSLIFENRGRSAVQVHMLKELIQSFVHIDS